MTDVDALVKRLLTWGAPTKQRAKPLMREAATVLAASEAARIKAEGEVERLREALKPFAKHIDEMRFDIDNKGNPLPDDQAVGWVYVTNGDFRRARAALQRESSTALESGKTEGGGE